MGEEMNWLRRLFAGSLYDDAPIDHLPIMADDPRPAKLAQARERFGKPWAIEYRVPRKTEPSDRLRAIEAKVIQLKQKTEKA